MNRTFKVWLSRLWYFSKKNIVLGKEAYIGGNSHVFGTQLHIDDYTGVENLIVIGSQPAHIGKYCALAGHLTIVTSNHILDKPNIQARLQHVYFHDPMDDGKKGGVTIGNNVWIGLHALLLPGVSIGDGAVIGAGSVVTKSVEPFTIVAGNPAKVIRKRFAETTIQQLLADPWWEWDTEKIKNNKEFFVKTLK